MFRSCEYDVDYVLIRSEIMPTKQGFCFVPVPTTGRKQSHEERRSLTRELSGH